MRTPPSAQTRGLENKTFLLLVIAVTLAFAWMLAPFYGALFWATALAVLFTPVYARLCRRMKEKPTLAAIATIAIILVLVILPAAIITNLLLKEGLGVYARIQSGEIDFRRYAQQIFDALPAWITGILDRFGLTSLGAVQERASAGMSKSIQFLAANAVDVGQGALDFVVQFFIMLYVLFFVLRDGAGLVNRAQAAIPLDEKLQSELAARFATVIRATVKGNIVIAIIQGTLGGVMFWILGIHAPVLWGVVMAFMSLVPAVGTALVWLPCALYLLAIGETVQGLVLVAFGVLVIGMVDNVVRPVLVGKDTKIPDYVVLLSTAGGIGLFGLNGFVIGPVIAAMFITVWDVMATSRHRPAARVHAT